MKIPTVAVITRTKNRPALLERAILSVMAQSLQDFIMVIVNDGGDPKPIEALLKKHSKVIKSRARVIHNAKSVGMEGASNVGIGSSESKYIALLDDDDTWEKNFLETTIQFLETHELEGVATASSFIKEVAENSGFKQVSKKRFAPFITQILYFSELGINQIPNNSFVFSRKAFKAVGEFNEGLDVLGDWDFNKRFLGKYDVAFINLPLANFHQRDSQTGPLDNTSTERHDLLTSEILNAGLRKEIESGKLGGNFVANISNYIHRVHMDIRKDLSEIHQIKDADLRVEQRLIALDERLAEIENTITSLNQKINSRLSHKITKKILGRR